MTWLTLCFLCLAVAIGTVVGQEDGENALPYREIPAYPDEYTEGTVAGRLIDGLGFRYFWATEGLREEDLNFKPSPEARTTMETLEHIYGLSLTIVNAPQSKPNMRRDDERKLSFAEMRKATLENIAKASKLVKSDTSGAMANYEVIFQRGERKSVYPFWNMLNGPIADAIWHTGQVVSFRRSSGNPFNSKASLFQGKLRE